MKRLLRTVVHPELKSSGQPILAPEGRRHVARGVSPWKTALEKIRALRGRHRSQIIVRIAPLLLLLAAQAAHAQSSIDRVRRQNGVDSGKITAITPLGITITKGSVETTVPVEDVESISLAGEPQELATARNSVQLGRWQETLDALGKIAAGSVQRDETLTEIEFYTALAKAQLALAGQGAADAAATEMRGFLTRRNKSFHVPQAIEVVGDLLSAAGQHASARTEYAKLAKAKNPFFQLKSSLLLGRSWQAEADQEKALAEFDKVLAATEQSPLIDSMKLDATLGRAVSQAATGKVEDAAAAIGKIVVQAKPDDTKLLARAYNALGDCYLKSGDNRAALFAFLHVDLLYNQEPDAHAKALHELIALWKAVGQDKRSQESAQELAQKYPNSRWTKK